MVYIDFYRGPWNLNNPEDDEANTNTHPILHERVKPCSKDLDRPNVSYFKRKAMHYEGRFFCNQIGIGERVL